MSTRRADFVAWLARTSRAFGLLVCGPTKKKTGPDRDPAQFAGVGAPTITFQRGTAACIVVAIWEDGATESPRSTNTMRWRTRDAQREALHVSHAESVRGIGGIYVAYMRTHCRLRKKPDRLVREAQKFQRCALATRKSRKACTRATLLSSSG